MAGQHYPSIHEFASAIPNHLLLGSLLEHLCFVYESNPSRAHVLFKGRSFKIIFFKLYITILESNWCADRYPELI